jgi:hypothetical protein
MAVNKNFVVKHGLEVDGKTLFVDAVNNRVGVATTIPGYDFEVDGKANVKDQLISKNAILGVTTAGTVGVTTLTVVNTNVSGTATIGGANITSLSVTGNSTIGNEPTDTVTFNAQVASNFDPSTTDIYDIGAAKRWRDITAARTINATTFIGAGVSVTGVTTARTFNGSHINLSGVSTFTNGPILLGSGTTTGTLGQTLQVTGSAYISGNTGIGTTNPTSKLHVIGDTLVTGVSTVGTALSVVGPAKFDNSITVTGIATVGTALSVVGPAKFDNSITVTGIATVGTALSVVGPAKFDNHLTVTGIATVGTALSVVGPAKFDNNIAVTGVSTFTGDVLVSGFSTITKAVIFSSDVNVSGATTVGTALSVTGPTKLNTHLAVTGVSTFTGDVLVSGFSTITKAAIFSSDVNVSGATTVGTALSVTGPTKLNTHLAVTGVSTFTGDVLVSGFSTITKAAIFSSDVNVSGATSVRSLSIGSTQVISNDRQLQNIVSLDAITTATIETAIINAPSSFTDLTVTGITTFVNGPVLIGSGTSTGTVSQPFQVTGGGYVSGNTGIGTTNPTSKLHVIGDTLVTGVSTVGTALSVVGPAKFDNSITVTGIATVGTALSVVGPAKFDNSITVTGIATVGTALSVVGSAKFDRNLAVTGVSTFTGDVLVSGFATVTKAAIFSSDVNVSAAATVGAALSVVGSAKFDSNVAVTGVSTFTGTVNVGFITATNSYVSGVTTVGTLIFTSLGGSSGATIPFITNSQLNVTGIATINNLNVTGVSTLNAVNITGLTTTQNVRVASGTSIFFPDNSSAYFGDSNDLQIYHDGSNSYIKDLGTGDLYLEGTNVYIRQNGAENSLVAKQNGAVELYYDNVKEFETTGLGVTVFGTTQTQELNVSGVSTFTGTVNAGFITATNAYISGVATVGTLIFDSIGGSSGAVLPSITNTFLTVSGVATINQANITTLSVSGLSTFTNGPLLIGSGTSTGTVSQRVQVTGGAYVSDNMGIGITNPTSKLHVVGDTFVTGVSTVGTALSVVGPAKFDNNIAVTGVSSFTGTVNAGFITATNAYISGVTTVGTLIFDSIGGSSGAVLPSITNTFLTVSGVATIAQLNVSDRVRSNLHPLTDATYDVGIGTLRWRNSNFSGIITASQFSTGATGTGFNISGDTISGPSLFYIDPAAVGDNTGAVRIKGDLYVDGTQFVVNSSTIELADFNVGIATTVGTNALLDGAGIGIGSTGIRKTLTWDNTNSALKSSENFNLATGKVYEIDGTEVLSSTQLTVANINSSGISTLGVTTFTGNVSFGTSAYFGDNDAAYFGDSNDLQIYHDGSNSIVRDFGTGDLFLSGSNAVRITNSLFTESKAVFNSNGSVELYYDNSKKFETTGLGVTVFGTTQTQELNVSGVSTVSNLVLTGTVSAASSIGVDGQYLKSTGVGVTWATFPSLRNTGITTATNGQTTFNFAYNINFLDVFVNGVKLSSNEYTANNGSTVILANECFQNDIVELVSYNTVSGSGSGSSGAVILNDLTDVTLNAPASDQVLKYDGTEWVNDYPLWRKTSAGIHTLGFVGIGTTNPTTALSVGGTITELYNGTYWNVVTQADVGYGASQVPLNQYLGQLAFLDQYSPSGLRRSGGGSDDVVVSAGGSVGIGSTIPTATLTIATAGIASDGNSQIYLNGATSNRIDFNTFGVAAPAAVGTSGTTRSAGTKITLYPAAISTSVDYALGIDNNTLWSSVSNSAASFKWYAGTVGIATLSGSGALSIGGTFRSTFGDVSVRRVASANATVTMSGTPANTATIVATGNVGIVTFATAGIGATINVTGMIAGQTFDLFVNNPTTVKTLVLQYNGVAIPVASGISSVGNAPSALGLNQNAMLRYIVVGTTSDAPVAGNIRLSIN